MRESGERGYLCSDADILASISAGDALLTSGKDEASGSAARGKRDAHSVSKGCRSQKSAGVQRSHDPNIGMTKSRLGE